MRIKFLLIMVCCLIKMGFSQESEDLQTPLIEIASIESDFTEFVISIFDKESNTDSNCDKYYWHLFELNSDLILTKSPLSSILFQNVTCKDCNGMLVMVGKDKLFININSKSILNKKIYRSGFSIDFNDFDINDGDISFYDCIAYQLEINRKRELKVISNNFVKS